MKSILILLNVMLLITSSYSQVKNISISENKTELKNAFEQNFQGNWNFRWNDHGTPHRILGSNISQNFNAGDPVLTEQYAQQFISDNQYLFGINPNNLEVWVNEQRGNIRYLVFNQIHNGIPVWNARVDFRYRLNGDIVLIGNDGFPDLIINSTASISSNQAIINGQMEIDFNEDRNDYIVKAPEQFIWVNKSSQPEYYLSWLVELYVHSTNTNDELPVHHWKIFIDAHSGEILEKFDIVKSALISGFVTGNVKDEPYGLETSRGIPNVEVEISGVGSTYTDLEGYYTIDIGESNRTATIRMDGNYLYTNNQNGSDAQISRTVIPGNEEDFHFSNTNSYAGERDTYFHGNVIHTLVKSIHPSFNGVDYQMPAYVNINDNCNAYWDGYSINMYSAGGGCAATDQMADVVYHEYGHGIQQNMYSPYDAPFNTGLGEGCADYWAMTIVNSPCLGNGFFGPGSCLRDGENLRQYPGNDCGGQVHCLGEITMGAMWKMRENLITTLGYDQGVEQADMVFYFGQTGRPYSEPDLLEEILIADDNDGSIENGTPHYVEICDAFEVHNVECPISGPLSQLDFSPESLYFEVPPEATDSQDITLYNTGDSGSILNYSIGVTPFENSQGGPDSGGNFWTDSDNEENIEFDWIDISETGVQYSFPNNDQAGSSIDIGFDFPFYGNLYNECIINANGWLGFGEDNPAWDNIEIPSSSAPSPAIFGLWDDLNPVNDNCNEYCAGEVYYHSNSDRLVVWFDHVAHWWTGFEDTFYDFQMVLYPNGKILLNYNEIIGNYSATVGIQNTDGSSGLQVMNDENYVHDGLGIQFSMGPTWISPYPTFGELMQGEQENVEISVDATGLLPDEYTSFVIIASTGGMGNLPVTMSVAGSTVPGDVNGDEALNILDIVTMVNFIIGGIMPEPWQFAIGDMNDDGTLNILDIVIIINIILDE